MGGYAEKKSRKTVKKGKKVPEEANNRVKDSRNWGGKKVEKRKRGGGKKGYKTRLVGEHAHPKAVGGQKLEQQKGNRKHSKSHHQRWGKEGKKLGWTKKKFREGKSTA